MTLIIKGARSCSSFTTSRDGDLIAFSATDPAHPTEIFVAGADGTDRAPDLVPQCRAA